MDNKDVFENDNLYYIPEVETLETIEWCFLENRYVSNLGDCYKTIEDIPSDFIKYVIPIKENLNK